MSSLFSALLRIRTTIRQTLLGPPLLAFLPAVVLGAFWIGGEGWLIGMSLALPVLYAAIFGITLTPARTAQDKAVALQALVDQHWDSAKPQQLRFALFLLRLDDMPRLIEHHGSSGAHQVIDLIEKRLATALRSGDQILNCRDGEFAVLLAPVKRLELEDTLQLACRLKKMVEDPILQGQAKLHLTCSVGFIVDRQLPAPDTHLLIDGAEAALEEARANGPSAIRAYAPGMKAAHIQQSDLFADCDAALEDGQIHPWFQPQISCRDGNITGVEALARWQHPQRGLVPPADFLPALHQAGLLDRLGDRMLSQGLKALSEWDAAGLTVPSVGINFSTEELRNPQLLDKVNWTLDRYDLPPHRLTIEVLESVVSTSPEDMIARNLNRLAQLGCRIDLDDFGTGHASIAVLQQFPVTRLKFDRSFIAGVEGDSDQQQLVAAMLTMAKQLDLEVLAEGVETDAQRNRLTAMGCDHLQGYGIARPMPFAKALEWIRKYERRGDGDPTFGRRTG